MEQVSCDKKGFRTYSDGIGEMAGLSKKNRKYKYRIYKCPQCGMFHITTITKRKLQNRSKKLDKYPIKLPAVSKKPTAKIKSASNKPRKENSLRWHHISKSPSLTPIQIEILKHKILLNS